MHRQARFLCMRTQRMDVDSPQVRLRVSEFEKHSKARGLSNALARARFIGVHHATVGRIERGERCGERFIAQVLAAFPDKKFEDLFEIAIPADQALKDAS
jgi:DNA-binding XRE family transcriptional regulator